MTLKINSFRSNIQASLGVWGTDSWPISLQRLISFHDGFSEIQKRTMTRGHFAQQLRCHLGCPCPISEFLFPVPTVPLTPASCKYTLWKVINDSSSTPVPITQIGYQTEFQASSFSLKQVVGGMDHRWKILSFLVSF